VTIARHANWYVPTEKVVTDGDFESPRILLEDLLWNFRRYPAASC
jgi:hypothetical protein